jgi:cyclopropane-fatty-acyl-phospholipid synthase
MTSPANPLARTAFALLDRDVVPDRLIRAGIRRVIASRLRELGSPDDATALARRREFARRISAGPIAVATANANAQHYEVPTEFYRLVLGRHLKYSSGCWDGARTLDDAEARMLAITAERAALADGQRVLELGCGWGSLSLWMASRYPASRVVAFSNSATQKAWIDAEARRQRLSNLEVVTADINHFDASGTFDRVVSVEMFEHLRNWRALFERIVRWLTPDGRMFLHIFTHRRQSYVYDARDASDWMATHFFTGGIMPGDDLIYEFDDVLKVESHWRVNGRHYQRTAEAWLANLDRHRAQAWPILIQTYGAEAARTWWVRWRVFFMSCAELWGWNRGEEWGVSHYRLRRH